MKISIVIPARNESGNIGTTLDEVRSRLRREEIPYEIIVVDDGSTDSTIEHVQARCGKEADIRLIQNTGPHGFGYAVRCGLDAFQGDAVAILMADGSDAPDDLVTYYYLLRDRAECAFGSRFLSASKVENYPWVKLILNRWANLFIRLLFGIRYNDTTNAFKAYRANVVQGCRPFLSPHFNLTVELPLKAIVRGYSYEVVPINWRQRRRGTSHFQLKEMGSRYLFIVLYVFLERLLTKGDYHRSPDEDSRPWKASSSRIDGSNRLS